MPVAGIDEAGRGCLAGPVVASAVILPDKAGLARLTDSKKLSPSVREELAGEVKAASRAWSLGLAWPAEIDRLNILEATMLAMSRAVKNLGLPPDQLLVDGNRKIPVHICQRTIVDGDVSEPCISAASILAKTFRDKLMFKLDKRYPGYGLAKHKGYGTREHLHALRVLGPCSIHRRSFKGVLPRTRERVPCLPLT